MLWKVVYWTFLVHLTWYLENNKHLCTFISDCTYYGLFYFQLKKDQFTAVPLLFHIALPQLRHLSLDELVYSLFIPILALCYQPPCHNHLVINFKSVAAKILLPQWAQMILVQQWAQMVKAQQRQQRWYWSSSGYRWQRSSSGHRWYWSSNGHRW